MFSKFLRLAVEIKSIHSFFHLLHSLFLYCVPAVSRTDKIPALIEITGGESANRQIHIKRNKEGNFGALMNAVRK